MNLYEEIKEFQPWNLQEESDKRVILKYYNDMKEIFTRENEVCHFTASSWIVNKEKTKILMAYHNIYNSWAWTGGHADGDENMLEVAMREANEETAIKDLKPLCDGIFSIEILPVNPHIRKGKFVSAHLHLNCCYLFEADEKMPLKVKEDENSAVSWISIDKINEVVTEEEMKIVYDKLNKKMLQYCKK